MSVRERVRARIARHENLFTFLWYLHLIKNEPPQDKVYIGTAIHERIEKYSQDRE